jgi:hypothetical protein
MVKIIFRFLMVAALDMTAVLKPLFYLKFIIAKISDLHSFDSEFLGERQYQIFNREGAEKITQIKCQRKY